MDGKSNAPFLPPQGLWQVFIYPGVKMSKRRVEIDFCKLIEVTNQILVEF